MTSKKKVITPLRYFSGHSIFYSFYIAGELADKASEKVDEAKDKVNEVAADAQAAGQGILESF